jgi:amino acid adenylation domain-containing protein
MPEPRRYNSRPTGESHPAAARWAAAQAALLANSKTLAIVARAPTREVAATFAQERLWFIEQLNPGTALHNLPIICQLRGPLSANALAKAANAVVDRNEILRTRVHSVAGALTQSIGDANQPVLTQVNLENLSAADQQAELDRLAGELAQRPFVLTEPLLPRMTLVRTDGQSHCLILCFHHLVFDGWSFAVFMRELSACYNRCLESEGNDPTVIALQYRDYALWQHALPHGDRTDASRTYWRETLRSPPEALRLPTDTSGRARVSGRGAVLPFDLSQEQSAKLLALCSADGVSLFVMLLSIFKVLLFRVTARQDLWVGCPVANRPRAELAHLMGVFVNTVVIRTKLIASGSFRRLLADVQSAVHGALAHQALPFQQVVADVAPQRDASGAGLLQVMFAHQNLPSADHHFKGLSVDLSNLHNGCAGAELTLFSWLKNGQIGGLWEWDTGLYEHEEVSQWAALFETLLASIVSEPDTAVASQRLMDDRGLQACINSGAGPATNTDPTLTILSAFQRQLSCTQSTHSDAVAIVDAMGSLSYVDLDRRATELGTLIRLQNTASRPYIGLCLPPSRERVIAMLGILKAGLAYVPLSCTEPINRLRQIIFDAQIDHVVTSAHLAARIVEAGASLMLIDDDDAQTATDHACAPPSQTMTAESLACVMYTSGSSGKPKGVCIAHRGITRLVLDANYLAVDKSDVFLQLAPVAFDASIFEIWGALLNGARLVMPRHEQPSLHDIAELVVRHSVSVLWLTSGLFEAMVDEQFSALGRVRALLVGGDVLSTHHAKRFVDAFPSCLLLNCYGPTENTTFTTVHTVNATTSFNGTTVPIGRAISGGQIYVLDEHLQPVPQGVVGEAWVAGRGLMQGYLVTGVADSGGMRTNPYSEVSGSMLYDTGDRVRQRRDGALEFIGRVDERFKISGHRVELAEVTAALCQCSGVTRGAVVIDGSRAAQKRLVAFVTVEPSGDHENAVTSSIRAALRLALPSALVPAEIRVLPSMPFTPIGKLDRAALQREAATVIPVAATHVVVGAPRGALETLVAAVFASAIGVPAVGRDDNFFDIGGHSLLALRVLAALESSLQCRIPLVSLFKHPTPAGLAVALTNISNAAAPVNPTPLRAASLVEIKRGTCSMPLFVVPGGHGGMVEMTLYARLMERLGGDLTVFGMMAQGLDGQLEPHDSVSAMASAYLNDIRSVQAEGPYALCGECVGGVIALEMAQQLLAKGERVASLVLLDTWLPNDAGVRHFRWIERPRTLFLVRTQLLRAACVDLTHVLIDLLAKRPRGTWLDQRRYMADVAHTLKRIALAWTRKVVSPQRVEVGREAITRAEENYVDVTMRYRAQPYAGRVNIIACASNAKLGIFKDWARLAGGGLSTHTVPGTHDNYIQKFSDQTSDALRQCLNQSGRGPQPSNVDASQGV